MTFTNTRQQEYLTHLPIELLDHIGRSIGKIGDLKYFVATNKSIYSKIGSSVISRAPVKALMYYAAVNDVNGIERALSARANINARYKLSDDEQTKLLGADKLTTHELMPLHVAVITGSLDAAAYLAEQGANLDAVVDSRKATALWLATEIESIAMVRLLHSKGSDINQSDLYGTTPLHLSSKKGNTEIAQYLLDLGADVDAEEVGRDSDTALEIAAHRGDIDMVRLLQTNGGDINHADRGGSTALHHAALYTDMELTHYLLIHNADVHKQDRSGNTALGLAAQELAAAPFRYSYFSKGALMYDPKGKTYRSREIYKLLLESGSDRFHRNNEGDTPIKIYQKLRERWTRYIRDGISW